MKLLTKTPHDLLISRMYRLINRPKVNVTMHWLLKFNFNTWSLLCLYIYRHKTTYKAFKWSKEVLFLISGSERQRSGSKCIDYWKRLFGQNCFASTPIFMKLHTETSHELMLHPIDFRVRRSKVYVTMHWSLLWFMLHNCFPFITVIRKLHTHPQTSQGCALLIVGKRV